MGKPDAAPKRIWRRQRPEQEALDGGSRPPVSSVDDALNGLFDDAVPDTSLLYSLDGHSVPQSCLDGGGEAAGGSLNAGMPPAPALSPADAPGSLLPPALLPLPRSHMEVLCSDGTLSVCACKVYQRDALLLALFLSNACDLPLEELSCDVTSEEVKVPRAYVFLSRDGRRATRHLISPALLL